MESNKSIFLTITVLLVAALMVACSPASTTEPAQKPTHAISTAATEPHPTVIPTESATNTPEPTQTPTMTAYEATMVAEWDLPIFYVDLPVGDGYKQHKLIADPNV
jgi:hypothetical protein